MNQPEKKFSAGAISATVWKNTGTKKTGEESTYHTISLQRSYKDKSDAWQHTSSLRVNDLPKAALCLKKAYEYLVFKDSKEEIAPLVGVSSADSYEEIVM